LVETLQSKIEEIILLLTLLREKEDLSMYYKVVDTLLKLDEPILECKSILLQLSGSVLNRILVFKGGMTTTTSTPPRFRDLCSQYCLIKAVSLDPKSESLPWYTKACELYLQEKNTNLVFISDLLGRAECIKSKQKIIPWMESLDSIVPSTNIPFVDEVISLNKKQNNLLTEWRRLECSVVIVPNIDRIIQSHIGDCSLVASIIVAIDYETKFKTKILTNIIYPQKEGIPIPSCKHHIKLHHNGHLIKVVIDNLFPYSKNDILTSCSKEESYVSLLEKAYMKLNGSYSFQGSNSGIDLYTLIGWIPEECNIKSFQLWDRMTKAFQYGDCLVTFSTSYETSLRPLHAYSMLSIKEGQFLIRDPLKRSSFWMTQQEMVHSFHSIHINWNPTLFSFVSQKHFTFQNVSHVDHICTIPHDGITWIMFNRHVVGNRFTTFYSVQVKEKSKIIQTPILQNDPNHLISIESKGNYTFTLSSVSNFSYSLLIWSSDIVYP
jgi:hypothetical protein